MTLTRSSTTFSRKKPLRRGGWLTIRRDALRILWSRIVRARDHHTCQKCGKTEAQGQISAAHILGVGPHANLKYLTSNGISMCEGKDCHPWLDAHKNRDHMGDGDKWARAKIGWKRYDELLIMAKVYRRPGKDEIKIGLKELAKQYGVAVGRAVATKKAEGAE